MDGGGVLLICGVHCGNNSGLVSQMVPFCYLMIVNKYVVGVVLLQGYI